MEHPQRDNRPPSPMPMRVSGQPGADARLEEAAAAAVAVANGFDVRASLTRMGSIHSSQVGRLDDLIRAPRRDVDEAVAAIMKGSPPKSNSSARQEGVQIGQDISNGMKKGADDGANGDAASNIGDGDSPVEAKAGSTGVGDDDDDDGDDVEMIASKASLDGPCQSVEDASVKTTVESSTAEPIDAGVETPSTVKLRLTPEESRLFRLLTSSAEAYEAGHLAVDPNGEVSARGGFVKQDPSDEKSWLKPPPKVEKIEIRVAGGWVRDKLLEQHSCDVDVALDCMMGVQFARIVQSHMALQQDAEEKKCEGAKAKEEGAANGDAETTGKCCQDSKPSKKGKAKKQNQKKTKQPKIGVIGANPSQSKHLETATMNIHNIDVDFVNLRAEEVYLPGSRIPTSDTRMFGTPLEDALRRDFTINSLFYNVRSGRIEDWTGRGLDDLMTHRRIVTPVDPHVTFHDDPLRVLRAIRFAVRLGFELDDPIAEAARSKRVHHSLHVKVSRERVGKEVEGMLSGKHARPAKALDMIAELHLAGSVFCFPGSFPGDVNVDGNYLGKGGALVSGNILGVEYSCSLGSATGSEATKLASKQRARGWEESSALLALLPVLTDGHADEREGIVLQETLPMPLTEVNERLLHLCVFILPFHNLTFPDKKGTRTISVTAHMIKEALKFPVRDVQAVSKILSNVDEMTAILSEVRAHLSAGTAAPLPLCRLRLGLMLRSLKEHWVTCLLTAAAWEIRSHERREREIEGDDFREMLASATASVETTPASAMDRPSRELYRAIVSVLDLDECWKVPPHLNGKDMIKELSLPKGPIVGEYLDDQTRWMLLHPEGTREECAEHLRARKIEREEEEEKKRMAMAEDDHNEVNAVAANGEGQSASAQPIAEIVNGDKNLAEK